MSLAYAMYCLKLVTVIHMLHTLLGGSSRLIFHIYLDTLSIHWPFNFLTPSPRICLLFYLNPHSHCHILDLIITNNGSIISTFNILFSPSTTSNIPTHSILSHSLDSLDSMVHYYIHFLHTLSSLPCSHVMLWI